MATPANTTSTYDAIGNREDLSDVIYDISPMETPFMSGIARTTATATNHEWQTDELATASSSNAVIEGEDATTTAAIASVRYGNYTQISDKVPRVTRTQRQVNSAGRGDELDYQIMKMGKSLKRDMESALLANKAKAVGSESVARQCAGVESWIADNVSLGATGTAPTGDGTDTRGAGTARALDEQFLKDVLALCWDEGGNPDMIMTGSFNKQAMSAFVGGGTSGPAQRVVDGDSSRVNTAIDVYVSDFGSLAVVPNRFMVQSSMLVLEMDMWAMATLAEFQETPLAKTGDSDRVQILSEYTLEARNAKSSGIVADLTTS
ncbi:MAG: DUF5309 domain-containing protein [Proteobacteria bacterium]|nr:DUF5309 domain-containing protein [Pseudomonadota bacterium]